jgi:hypothetical protein
MFSITNPIAHSFQKVCVNCHVANVIIFPMGGVHCNVCHSKSMVQKLDFFCGSIATNDKHVLLIIKGKWLEAIVHMTISEFLDLPRPKQIQLLISIIYHICPCWLLRNHPIIYPTSKNQFES